MLKLVRAASRRPGATRTRCRGASPPRCHFPRACRLPISSWLEEVKGAKPSTLRDYRSALSEPGTPYLRGSGQTVGRIMGTLGDRPAREVTTRDIETLLAQIARTGVSPRAVNKARALVCAIFNYGMRPGTFALDSDPATHADRRSEAEPGPTRLLQRRANRGVGACSRCWRHRDRSRSR